MVPFTSGQQQTEFTLKLAKTNLQPIIMSAVGTPYAQISPATAPLQHSSNVEMFYNKALKRFMFLGAKYTFRTGAPQATEWVGHVTKNGSVVNSIIPLFHHHEQAPQSEYNYYQCVPLLGGDCFMPNLADFPDAEDEHIVYHYLDGINPNDDLGVAGSYHPLTYTNDYTEEEEPIEESTNFLRGCSDKNGYGWVIDVPYSTREEETLFKIQKHPTLPGLQKVASYPYPATGMPVQGAVEGKYNSWYVVVDRNNDIITIFDTQSETPTLHMMKFLASEATPTFVDNKVLDLGILAQEEGSRVPVAIDKYNNIWAALPHQNDPQQLQYDVLWCIRNNNSDIINDTPVISSFTARELFGDVVGVDDNVLGVYVRGLRADKKGNVFAVAKVMGAGEFTPTGSLPVIKLRPSGAHSAVQESMTVTKIGRCIDVEVEEAIGGRVSELTTSLDVSCEDELGAKNY